MFGSYILDLIIGLVFVYCLYSLLATIINEIIASFLGLRGKMLEQAIMRMLTDDDPKSILSNKLFAAFFQHPIIKYMNEDGSRKPSYISPREFSKALVEALKTAGNVKGLLTPESITSSLEALDSGLQSETVRLIRSFLEEANNDLVKFRALVEQWFNDMMDRASGWYKRQAQWILFVIGFVLAASLNVNTFEIVKRLSADRTTLGQVVQLATNFSKNHPTSVTVPSSTQQADSITIVRLDSLAIFADSLSRTQIKQANQLLGLGWEAGYSGWQIPIAFTGWLITALAISLGAPFWFDLLSKLVQLRGTGPKPGEED